jgi:hypothetical protein
MQTFIVRVVDAEDLNGLAGFVEEPLTGFRQPFRDSASLVASIRRQRERVASGRADVPARGPVDAPRDDGRSQEPSIDGRS